MAEVKHKKLSALDATLLVMGGIIGIGIFFNPAGIAERAYEPWAFLLVWIFGGLIAMCAAFTFAELGGSFPRTGGWFIFLREAFGPYPAFLFAWVVLGVISTGAIAAVAQFCAGQLEQLLPGIHTWLAAHDPLWFGASDANPTRFLASLVVLLVTAICLSGVKRFALVQNACMLIKLLAIGALIVFGLFLVHPEPSAPLENAALFLTGPEGAPKPHILRGMLTALLPVFFAFGGWQMVAYIAPEVEDPKKNLPRAIVSGVIGVIIVYVSVNYAYVSALGIEGLAGHTDFANTLATRALGASGGKWLGAGMAVSALGWVMVCVSTSPWLYVAMAKEKLFFQGLGRLHSERGVPSRALHLQAALAIGYIWYGSIDFLVDAVVSIEWIFHGLVALALIRLRKLRPELERPYVSPLFPLAPLIYCLAAVTVVISTVDTQQALNKLLLNMGLLVLGSLTYFLWTRKRQAS